MKWQTKKLLVRSGILCLLIVCAQSSAAQINSNAQAPLPAAESDADVNPVLGTRIAEGVVLAGELWLRGARGLISLNLADESQSAYFQRHADFELGVIDIEKAGETLWVLRSASENGHDFTVSVWKNNAFEDLPMLVVEKDEVPIALFNDRGRPAVLSGSAIHLFEAKAGSWRKITLAQNLRWGVQVAVASPQGSRNIYIGYNAGEFGGGLQRVNVRTGEVTEIDGCEPQYPCKTPIRRNSDPVTAVIPDPYHEECVLASTGLAHMVMSDGRILRICDKEVTVVLENPVERDSQVTEMTEAFFDLASTSHRGFWAVSWRALYHFNNGQAKTYPIPSCSLVAGISLGSGLITSSRW